MSRYETSWERAFRIRCEEKSMELRETDPKGLMGRSVDETLDDVAESERARDPAWSRPSTERLEALKEAHRNYKRG